MRGRRGPVCASVLSPGPAQSGIVLRRSLPLIGRRAFQAGAAAFARPRQRRTVTCSACCASCACWQASRAPTPLPTLAAYPPALQADAMEGWREAHERRTGRRPATPPLESSVRAARAAKAALAGGARVEGWRGGGQAEARQGADSGQAASRQSAGCIPLASSPNCSGLRLCGMQRPAPGCVTCLSPPLRATMCCRSSLLPSTLSNPAPCVPCRPSTCASPRRRAGGPD